MRYEVSLHPSGDSAIVSRIEPPRCTVAFSHEPAGWLCAGMLWFESAPHPVQIEAILTEAGEAVVHAVEHGDALILPEISRSR